MNRFTYTYSISLFTPVSNLVARRWLHGEQRAPSVAPMVLGKLNQAGPTRGLHCKRRGRSTCRPDRVRYHFGCYSVPVPGRWGFPTTISNAWALLMATLNLFGLETNPTCFLISSTNRSLEERTWKEDHWMSIAHPPRETLTVEMMITKFSLP